MYLVPTYTLYPHRLKGRKPLEHDKHIPGDLHAVYMEAYNAIVNELPVLAGIGLRAVLEMVCNERGVMERSLLRKIDDLEQRRIISPTDKDILHNLRFMGNQAAHAAQPHKSSELLAAFRRHRAPLEGLVRCPCPREEHPATPTRPAECSPGYGDTVQSSVL